MVETYPFYLDTVRALIADGQLDPCAPTLVVGGGEADRIALAAAGFSKVTISNLDILLPRADPPFKWIRQDAEG